MLEAFDTTEGKFSPDLGFFLNNLFFLFFENPKEVVGTFSQAKKLEVSFFI